jgi:hypothetical protein
MVVAFEGSPSFDWRTVLVEFPEAKIVLDRQENVSDEIAEQEREQARTLEKQFVQMYNDAKSAFDKLFQDGKEPIPASVGELVTRLQVPDGAFWSIGERLYSHVGKLLLTRRRCGSLLITAIRSERAMICILRGPV